MTRPASAFGMSTRLLRCAPTATKTASKPSPLGLEVGDPVLLLEDDAHGRDPGDLRVEDVARQPVGGDAVAHHPARQRSVVADDDVVPEPGQVVGGREPGRAGADDEHPATAADLRNGELPLLLVGEVTEVALDRVDRHRAVELLAVAARLARVVADPAVDRGERVVGGQLPPGVLVLADPSVREPGLDVLAGRTGVVARRQQVDVDRALRAYRTGAQLRLAEGREGGEVGLEFDHHGSWGWGTTSAQRRAGDAERVEPKVTHRQLGPGGTSGTVGTSALARRTVGAVHLVAAGRSLRARGAGRCPSSRVVSFGGVAATFLTRSSQLGGPRSVAVSGVRVDLDVTRRA